MIHAIDPLTICNACDAAEAVTPSGYCAECDPAPIAYRRIKTIRRTYDTGFAVSKSYADEVCDEIAADGHTVTGYFIERTPTGTTLHVMVTA